MTSGLESATVRAKSAKSRGPKTAAIGGQPHRRRIPITNSETMDFAKARGIKPQQDPGPTKMRKRCRQN